LTIVFFFSMTGSYSNIDVIFIWCLLMCEYEMKEGIWFCLWLPIVQAIVVDVKLIQ